MENINLPKIAKLGVYDAETAHPHIRITPKRRVSMFEIELPVEDGGVLHMDGRDYDITVNTLICAKPGSSRNTTLPFKCYYLHLDADGDIAACLSEMPGVFIIKKREKYIKLFREIILKYNSAGMYSDIIANAKIMELLYTILKESAKYREEEMGTNIRCNPIISDALKYIDENFTSKSTLDDLAKHVNLSPIYFHKLFKTSVGETPYQYILKKRLKKAVGMLMTGEGSFTDIAFDCGFSSQSYFNYVFKKTFGKTPGEYRSGMYDDYPDWF